MATEKQCEANRRNAQLSTGPKTPEGKEIVRFNALKHGLWADLFELAHGEDPAEFAGRLDGWNRVYTPANLVESKLVRQAVEYSWRIDRATRFENSTLALRVREVVMACDCDDNDVEALTEAAGLAFFDTSKEGDKLRRYQFALQRDLHRIMADLAKLQGPTTNRNPNETFGATEANFEEFQDARDARRGSPDLAETTDRRSPDFAAAVLAPPNAVESAIPVAQCDNAEGQGVDTPRSPTSVPPSPDPSAPNKATFGESSAVEKGDRHTEYREPVPVSAPNKANSSRGMRELERFVADQDRHGARDASWLDMSIEKR